MLLDGPLFHSKMRNWPRHLHAPRQRNIDDLLIDVLRGALLGSAPDDLVTAAAEDQIESFGKLLQEKFDTGRIGMMGAAEHLELEVLQRSVRQINSELMEIEVDQKHVPLLLVDFGLIQSNIVKTPR